MKRNALIALSLSVALLAAAIPLLAHHAIAAEFDTTKPIKFETLCMLVDRVAGIKRERDDSAA